jgi:hypothetical protein
VAASVAPYLTTMENYEASLLRIKLMRANDRIKILEQENKITTIFDTDRIEICTGCGTLQAVGGLNMSCCLDNNYIKFKDYFERSTYKPIKASVLSRYEPLVSEDLQSRLRHIAEFNGAQPSSITPLSLEQYVRENLSTLTAGSLLETTQSFSVATTRYVNLANQSIDDLNIAAAQLRGLHNPPPIVIEDSSRQEHAEDDLPY